MYHQYRSMVKRVCETSNHHNYDNSIHVHCLFILIDNCERSPSTVSAAWWGQKGCGNEGFMEDCKLWGV